MRLAEEIASFLPIPADLAARKLTGPWRGASYHCGPDGMSPLKKQLVLLTNAAHYTLASGALVWSAARLRALADVTPLLDIAEALFAFQQDAAYFRPPRRAASAPFVDPDELPRPTSTVAHLVASVRTEHAVSGGRWPAGRMFGFSAEVLVLTRFNLPKDLHKPFDSWTKKMIGRLDELATVEDDDPPTTTPEQKRRWATKVMGKPLPPSVLDLSREPRTKTFGSEWKRVLANLDWKSNRYLDKPKGELLPRR